jgi:hypothetical protein
VPLQFESQAAAEGWMHSAEGRETIAEIMDEARRKA